MAYTTINKSTDHFDSKIYLGSSSAVTVSGLGFQPDWVWVKDRDNGNNHCLVDAVRGVGKYLQSNSNAAEINNSSQSISAITSDGFTTGTANPANESASTTKGFISWNWKAGNSAGSSNSDGSIYSTVSANTTAGFSIVSYTGNATAGATVGHGLGAKPDFYILKSRDQTDSWYTYNKFTGATKTLSLHSTAGETSSSFANSTEPTSSVFSLGSASAFNGNGNTFIAYCFAEKQGYSKAGSYTANGSADGTFVYTGFAPKFIIMKRKDASSYNWVIYDDKRNTYNPWTNLLLPNDNNVEVGLPTNLSTDFLSNGFKLRSASGANPTTNQGTIIYLAIGQTLVGTNNVPAVAR